MDFSVKEDFLSKIASLLENGFVYQNWTCMQTENKSIERTFQNEGIF